MPRTSTVVPWIEALREHATGVGTNAVAIGPGGEQPGPDVGDHADHDVTSGIVVRPQPASDRCAGSEDSLLCRLIDDDGCLRFAGIMEWNVRWTSPVSVEVDTRTSDMAPGATAADNGGRSATGAERGSGRAASRSGNSSSSAADCAGV